MRARALVVAATCLAAVLVAAVPAFATRGTQAAPLSSLTTPSRPEPAVLAVTVPDAPSVAPAIIQPGPEPIPAPARAALEMRHLW